MNNSSRGLVAAALAIVVFIAVIWIVSAISLVSTDGGHVAVVRNGGPFDNRKIRDIIDPGSSKHVEGMYSTVHNYPASQRYYTISGDSGGGDRPGVDVFRGTTSDGVQGIGIEGTVQFTLNTSHDILTKFDNRFGTRTFPAPDGHSYHAWGGDNGWEAFLDAVFRRQILDNALRIEIQKYTCVDLIPSCSYLNGNQNQNASNGGKQKPNGNAANANLAQIQTNIQQELQSDLDSTLGGRFLSIGKFTISRVTLPPGVEQQVQDANAARVAVQRVRYEASQRVAAATGEKNANIQKAAGIRALNAAYAKSQAKASIDAIAALPQDLQTLVIGSGGGITKLVK